MSDGADGHRWCSGGCMLQVSQPALAKRGARYGLEPLQLGRLLQVLDGRCMVCLRNHAMVVDTARAGDRRPRGLLCRLCKTNVSVYEGSYSDDIPVLVGNRDAERVARMSSAIVCYLDRAGRAQALPTNRELFEFLIQDVSSAGVDPHGIWAGVPVSDLPQLPTREIPPSIDYGGVPPLERNRCANNCRDHVEHVYVSCFDEPTVLRDADTVGAVPHYVGWTRQQPPVRRVNQHGRACRESLVAIVPASVDEEKLLKAKGRCPKCDRPLKNH